MRMVVHFVEVTAKTCLSVTKSYLNGHGIIMWHEHPFHNMQWSSHPALPVQFLSHEHACSV